MRLIALLASLALGVSAFANGLDSVAGSYRLELPQDVKTTAQKLGMTEPYARILLRSDGTFTYASNNGGKVTGASGTFQLTDHQIKLIANGMFPAQNVKSLSGKADDNSLVIDGLRYVKAGSNVSLPGTYTLPDNKSIKMIFRDNKTFEFAGMAATSKGRYELEGDKLTLIWTEVDGEAVEPGSMRKVIFIREDGSFNIDTYRYIKN
jgi:hypothetical protein